MNKSGSSCFSPLQSLLSQRINPFHSKAAYKYVSLPDDKHIRLVWLQAEDKGKKLECRIQSYPVSIIETLEYEALSYAWGDLPAKSRIGCSEKIIWITPTLEAALLRFRQPHTERVLWVDQLCIDQGNDEERTTQVNLMRLIYSNAKRVLMWVGRDELTKAQLVVDLISRIDEQWWNTVDGVEFPTDIELEARDLPVRTAPHWDAWEELLNLPYFSRLWIVQEVRVTSSPILVWGTCEIDWKAFCNAIRWAQLSHAWISAPGRTGLPCFSIDVLLSAENQESVSWLYLLVNTRNYKATDPKDHYFALLGLVQEPRKDDLEPFKADYSKTLLQITCEVTKHIIKSTDGLVILSHVKHRNLGAISDTPSWIPDWTEAPPKATDMIAKFEASRETDAKPRADAGDKELILEGLVVGNVKVTTVNFEASVSAEQEYLPIHEAWELAKCYSKVSADTNLTMANFIRATTANQKVTPEYPIGMPADDLHLLDFAAFQVGKALRTLTDPSSDKLETCQRLDFELAASALAAYRSLTKDPMEGISARSEESNAWFKEVITHYHPQNEAIVDAAMRLWMSIPFQVGSWQRFREMFLMIGCRRRFFISEDGSMGVGPEAMRAGDIICVLFGGATPYILRRVGDSNNHLFVGECYVQGLMDGEALDRKDRGELVPEWFTLR